MTKNKDPKNGKAKKAKAPKEKKIKEHKNLDEYTKEQDIIDIAHKLKIPLKDHKVETLKALIRTKWNNTGVKELPFAAVMIKPKEPKKPKLLPKQNYTYSHHFTDEEVREKSSQLARACTERTQIEDEKKAVTSEYKHKLDQKNAEINLISSSLNAGFEKRTNTCEVKKDFEKGVKYFMYEGKKVGEEKLTAADHQAELEFAEEENKKEEEKK